MLGAQKKSPLGCRAGCNGGHLGDAGLGTAGPFSGGGEPEFNQRQWPLPWPSPW